MPTMGVSYFFALISLLTLSLAEKQIALHTWPLSAPSPKPYASITYNPTQTNTTIHPSTPFSDSTSSDLIRLGFYNPSSSTSEEHWTGIAVAAPNFSPNRTKTLTLWLDDNDEVTSLSFIGTSVAPAPVLSAKEKKKKREEEKKALKKAQKKAGKKEKTDLEVEKKKEDSVVGSKGSGAQSGEEVFVEFVRPVRAVGPVLNKPVVLNAEGRVDDKEPEKSFLQKYWWAIGLFLVLQVVMGGGGDDKK